MDPTNDPSNSARRDVMRQAACVAGAVAAGTLGVQVLPAHAVDAGLTRRYARTQLVDARHRPLTVRQITGTEPWIFNYPFQATPVFVMTLQRPPASTTLTTQDQSRYDAPLGVGPNKNLVAFSAICAHKLVYPTPQISFIGVRAGGRDEPERVIHCCADGSRYDATRGARVIAGPAPQPLAAVLLEWDAATDHLYAVGVQGSDLFQSFFEKYSFKLDMELGRQAREPSGAQCVTQPAETYSRQWKSCPG